MNDKEGLLHKIYQLKRLEESVTTEEAYQGLNSVRRSPKLFAGLLLRFWAAKNLVRSWFSLDPDLILVVKLSRIGLSEFKDLQKLTSSGIKLLTLWEVTQKYIGPRIDRRFQAEKHAYL
ncbi:MAG: hypothetical protein AB7P69_16380 [Candidatus Binatia bacterium]